MNDNRRTTRVLMTTLMLLTIAASVQAQRGGNGGPTHPAPTVSIISPTTGTSFTSPATISINVTATAATGASIKFVKIYVGANQLCNDTKSPFTCSWAGVAAGTYTLTAVATDNDNLATTSSAVVITVGTPAPAPPPSSPSPTPAPKPPTVSITSPGNGSSFKAPANVTITASASTVNSGATVTKVAFYVGSLLIGTSTTSPFTASWLNVASGKYSLSAIATDSTGTSATSTTVSVDVTTPTNAPPTVSLISPANGSSLTAPATISFAATAADSDGTIAQVSFYNGGTLVANIVSAPYSFAWNNVSAGTYTLTAQAVDNAGATTTSGAVTVTVTSSSPAPAPSTAPLLQPSSFVYQGAFRVPGGTFGSTIVSGTNVATFEYGGTGLGFNPTTNTLFLTGHDWGQLVAEISIPAIRNVTSIGDLATASVLQNFGDPTGGALYNMAPGYMKVGGLLPSGNALYISGFHYYDGSNGQVSSLFAGSTSLSQPFANGPYQIGPTGFCGTSNGNCAAFVDGYFGLVPSEWQKAFGGPVMAGNCCVAIVSRTSWGPSLVATDPSQAGLVNPLPIKPLVYYPQANPLSAWDSSNTPFNGTTEIRGVVFPAGTRTVVFFGRHGLGAFCYGAGTADQSLAGKPTPDGTTYCYDPTSADKGTHGYPYAYYAWAYDANDLASVAGGQAQPWDVKPYARWALDLPFAGRQAKIVGAAYDAKTQRIFLSEWMGDWVMPLIHVYTVQP